MVLGCARVIYKMPFCGKSTADVVWLRVGSKALSVLIA